MQLLKRVFFTNLLILSPYRFTSKLRGCVTAACSLRIGRHLTVDGLSGVAAYHSLSHTFKATSQARPRRPSISRRPTTGKRERGRRHAAPRHAWQRNHAVSMRDAGTALGAASVSVIPLTFCASPGYLRSHARPYTHPPCSVLFRSSPAWWRWRTVNIAAVDPKEGKRATGLGRVIRCCIFDPVAIFVPAAEL